MPGPISIMVMLEFLSVLAMCSKACRKAVFRIVSLVMLAYVCSLYCAVSLYALPGGPDAEVHTLVFVLAR